MNPLKSGVQNDYKIKQVKLFPAHDMKIYKERRRGLGGQLHSFSTSALERGEWLISQPGRFIAHKGPTYPLNKRMGGP
jgi:hypothetical protein